MSNILSSNSISNNCDGKYVRSDDSELYCDCDSDDEFSVRPIVSDSSKFIIHNNGKRRVSSLAIEQNEGSTVIASGPKPETRITHPCPHRDPTHPRQ